MKRDLVNKRWIVGDSTDAGFVRAELVFAQEQPGEVVTVIHNGKQIGSTQIAGNDSILCPITHPTTGLDSTLEVFLAKSESEGKRKLSVGLLVTKNGDFETATGVFTAEEEGETIDPPHY